MSNAGVMPDAFQSPLDGWLYHEPEDVLMTMGEPGVPPEMEYT